MKRNLSLLAALVWMGTLTGCPIENNEQIGENDPNMEADAGQIDGDDGEVCQNGLDDDGDGEIDEGCADDGCEVDADCAANFACESGACVPVDGPADQDGDGIEDARDNCPQVVNPDQADADGNGVGDACDMPEPVPCQTDDECAPDGICLEGECVPQLCGCPPIDEPVCGDDGQTYPNACEAQCSNVIVEHDGACDAPGGEICDGLDNNGNGAVDEDLGGDACVADVPGQCAAGTTMCVGGELVCASGTPDPEACENGLDDDCDGEVDEGCAPNGLCQTDDDCAANTQCVNGECQPVDPNDDFDGDGVPDGIDNCPAEVNPDQADSDGDGFGDACDFEIEACQVDADCPANQACVNGACAGLGGEEICGDGIDNNNNGIVDEGCPPNALCGVDADCGVDEMCVNGECLPAEGDECFANADCDATEVCVNGRCVPDEQVCVCPEVFAPVCGVDGETYPNACFAECINMPIEHNGACNEGGEGEICDDGIDNNNNGIVDEGCPPIAPPCNADLECPEGLLCINGMCLP